MTQAEQAEQFIKDAAAFLQTNSETKTWNDKIILATLIHDIMGLARNERCFSPRVSGYAAKREKVAHG